MSEVDKPTPQPSSNQKVCKFCEMPIAPGEERESAMGGYGHDRESRCIRTLGQEIARLRMALGARVAECDRLEKLCAETARTFMTAGRKLERAAIAESSGSPDETTDAQDAARYRLLRKGNDYKQEGPMLVLCEKEHIESDDRPFFVLSEAALDAAVDEARGAQKASEIPARSYPGDEEAVRQTGVPLPYCTCVVRASDDPHKDGCKFWVGILAARKLWMDRNVTAWSCSQEVRGNKRCSQWCGHLEFCTATGTDRRRSALKAADPSGSYRDATGELVLPSVKASEHHCPTCACPDMDRAGFSK